MLKKEAICHSDNFLFRADGETRTLARQCLAVHVSPQSGVRLTAPRGRCEPLGGGASPSLGPSTKKGSYLSFR